MVVVQVVCRRCPVVVALEDLSVRDVLCPQGRPDPETPVEIGEPAGGDPFSAAAVLVDYERRSVVGVIPAVPEPVVGEPQLRPVCRPERALVDAGEQGAAVGGLLPAVVEDRGEGGGGYLLHPLRPGRLDRQIAAGKGQERPLGSLRIRAGGKTSGAGVPELGVEVILTL